MLSRPEPACLVIADISGYTSYLAGTELDHAQDILADLMTTVVGALRPAFRLAKLEGDAAFVYVLAPRLDGSRLLDTVERTYFAFRRRLRDIAGATSCTCNACRLMPRLDLKLVLHHGEVVRHRIAGHEELVGPAVVLVHRLLKNSVVERLGFSAYAFFSAACVARMGIDPEALAMRGERETYEQIGEVAGWVHDLGAAWAEEAEPTRVVVAERDVGYAVERLLPAPLELVWTYVTDPSLRPLWQAGVTSVEELPTAARRGVGSTNHCVHGTDVLVEEILDWRPTEYLTLRTTLPDGFKLLGTYAFEDDPDGTRARLRFTWGRNRREREELGVVRGMLDQTLSTGLARLDEVLREAVAERASEAISAGPEPELPENRQRELAVPTTEPPAE